MARTIPTAFTEALINPADLMAGRYIRAETFEGIAEHQNYMYVHSGFRIPGIEFTDTPFSTTSTTYTTSNAGAGRDLDTWMAHGFAKRALNYSGVNRVRWSVTLYGQDIQLRTTIINPDTGTTLDTLVTGISSATPEWFTGSTEDTGVFLSGGVPRDVAFYVEARTISTEAKLFAFDIYEHVLTSGVRLPDNGT